jgi:hypothetical protein
LRGARASTSVQTAGDQEAVGPELEARGAGAALRAAQYDNLPINDRYDLWKSFELDGGARIGVAIEMERWEVWTDLLKFRRGIQRHQIAVGVILHDNPANLYYVYHHLRLISEPLFSALPVVFAAPEGEGLETAAPPSNRRFAPYRMPNDPAA